MQSPVLPTALPLSAAAAPSPLPPAGATAATSPDAVSAPSAAASPPSDAAPPAGPLPDAPGKPVASFRVYAAPPSGAGAAGAEAGVYGHYRGMRSSQTVAFADAVEPRAMSFRNARMSVAEAFDALERFVDRSDPDTTLPNSQVRGAGAGGRAEWEARQRGAR